MLENKQKDKLLKLVNLATSDNAHESATAFRTATKLLEKLGYSWAQILNSETDDDCDFCASAYRRGHEDGFKDAMKAARSKDRASAEKYRGSEIDMLIDDILSSEFNAFVESVSEFYDERGYVTEKQYNALKRIWNDLDE